MAEIKFSLSVCMASLRPMLCLQKCKHFREDWVKEPENKTLRETLGREQKDRIENDVTHAKANANFKKEI